MSGKEKKERKKAPKQNCFEAEGEGRSYERNARLRWGGGHYFRGLFLSQAYQSFQSETSHWP